MPGYVCDYQLWDKATHRLRNCPNPGEMVKVPVGLSIKVATGSQWPSFTSLPTVCLCPEHMECLDEIIETAGIWKQAEFG